MRWLKGRMLRRLATLVVTLQASVAQLTNENEKEGEARATKELHFVVVWEASGEEANVAGGRLGAAAALKVQE